MANVGSLVVEMSANIAKFQSDMGKAAAIAEQRMAQVDKAIGLVKTSMAALGVGFALGATLDSIKDKITGTIKFAADLQHLAEKTGSTAESLSQLAGIAKLSETSTDDFGKGLTKLAKSMVDAQNGGAKTSASFKAIGISTEEIKNKSPADAFKLIATRMNEYADGAEKTTIAQNLLGKAGANLLPMMNDLATAGDLQVKVTNEQAAMADEYEKNLVRLKVSTNAVFKTIAMEALPVLDAFTKAMLESQNANDGVRKSVKELAADGSIRSWAEGAANAAAFVVDVFDGAIRAFQATGKTMAMVAAVAVEIPSMLASGSTAGVKAIWDGYKGDLDAIAQKEQFSAKVTRQLAAARNEAAKSVSTRKRIDASGLGGDEKGSKTRDPFSTELESLERTKTGMDYVIENFEKFEGKVKESKVAMAEFDVTKGKFSDAARKELGLSALTDDQIAKYKKLNAEIEQRTEQERQLQVLKKFSKEAENVNYGWGKEISAKQFEIDLLGRSTLEQQKLTDARKVDLQIQDELFKLNQEIGKKGLSVTQKEIDKHREAVAALYEKGEAAKKAMNDASQAKYNKESDPYWNMTESLRRYGEEAANVGKQVGDAMTNSIKAMEDALVSFVMTGKMNWKSLADSIISEIVRIQIKQMLSGIFGNGSSGMGLLGMIGGLFGGGTASVASSSVTSNMSGFTSSLYSQGIPGYASGGDFSGGLRIVGENGPEIEATGASRIFSASQTRDMLSGGASVHYAPVISIDSRTDRNEVFALVTRAVQNGNAQLVDRLQRQGRLA